MAQSSGWGPNPQHPLLEGVAAEDRADLCAALEYMDTVVMSHGASGASGPPAPPSTFDRGSNSWFWYVLACFKPWKALYDPAQPLLRRDQTAKEAAIIEARVCAGCKALTNVIASHPAENAD